MWGALNRLDSVARNVLPLTLSMICVLLSAMPFQVPHFGPVAPGFALIAVFYWSVYRPDLLPGSAAFAVGLTLDLIAGTPMGINTMVLLLVHGAVVNQRTFFQGKSFLVIWWAFSLVAIGAGVLIWILTMALHARLLDPAPVVFQVLLTIAMHPFVTWVFARVQHALLSEQGDVPG